MLQLSYMLCKPYSYHIHNSVNHCVQGHTTGWLSHSITSEKGHFFSSDTDTPTTIDLRS